MKEIPAGTEAISHQLLLRAGLVNMLTAGVYSYLPLGLRVLNRISNIIREEMNAIDAHELLLPCVHPIDIWKQTGRDKDLDEVMIKFQTKRGREMCLGPTHEEIITQLVKEYIQSYRQLPVTLYQIQTKFRDEMRPRFGIVRACEFIMKDAYSFDRNQKGLDKNYQLMSEAYKRIFQRCGLEFVVVEADSGAMGGDVSQEFMVPAEIGEDIIYRCSSCGFERGETEEKETCPKCSGKMDSHPAIELGHIFQLGTKYSQAQGAVFLDEDGKQKPIIMGCYGIGVSRVIAAIIEKHNDAKGIIWPREVSPFDIEVLPLKVDDDESMALAKQYAKGLRDAGLEVLVDDRDESPGRKFNDADLIGVPTRVVIGKRTLKEGNVEIKDRRTDETTVVHKDQTVAKLMETLKT